MNLNFLFFYLYDMIICAEIISLFIFSYDGKGMEENGTQHALKDLESEYRKR